MIVDTHVHIWEMPPIAPIGPTAPRWNSLPAEPATAEQLIEDMDANGVDVSVLVQTSWSTWDNGYVADGAKRFPDRFVAQGMINPLDPANTDSVAYWMDERGMTGFRFHPGYYLVDDPSEGEILTKPENAAMFEAIQARKGIVQVHCQAQYAGQMNIAVGRYPGITWLIDHMMYPLPEMAADGWVDYRPVLDIGRHPNVLIKISDVHNRSHQEFPYADMHDAVKLAIDAFGIENCMWGTGYPGHHRTAHGWPTLAEEIRIVREGFDWLSGSETNLVLGGNAARVWNLGAGR
jgi:predicted TIM-barrel fold metal-dependent hydrolase